MSAELTQVQMLCSNLLSDNEKLKSELTQTKDLLRVACEVLEKCTCWSQETFGYGCDNSPTQACRRCKTIDQIKKVLGEKCQ